MDEDAPSLEEIRQEALELIEADKWKMTEISERTGRRFLRDLVPFPTQLSIVNHLKQLLKEANCSLVPVPMGIPEGSGGPAYRIRDPRSPDLSIKVKIEGDLLWILSFKKSDHRRRH